MKSIVTFDSLAITVCMLFVIITSSCSQDASDGQITSDAHNSADASQSGTQLESEGQTNTRNNNDKPAPKAGIQTKSEDQTNTGQTISSDDPSKSNTTSSNDLSKSNVSTVPPSAVETDTLDSSKVIETQPDTAAPPKTPTSTNAAASGVLTFAKRPGSHYIESDGRSLIFLGGPIGTIDSIKLLNENGGQVSDIEVITEGDADLDQTLTTCGKSLMKTECTVALKPRATGLREDLSGEYFSPSWRATITYFDGYKTHLLKHAGNGAFESPAALFISGTWEKPHYGTRKLFDGNQLGSKITVAAFKTTFTYTHSEGSWVSLHFSASGNRASSRISDDNTISIESIKITDITSSKGLPRAGFDPLVFTEMRTLPDRLAKGDTFRVSMKFIPNRVMTNQADDSIPFTLNANVEIVYLDSFKLRRSIKIPVEATYTGQEEI